MGNAGPLVLGPDTWREHLACAYHILVDDLVTAFTRSCRTRSCCLRKENPHLKPFSGYETIAIDTDRNLPVVRLPKKTIFWQNIHALADTLDADESQNYDVFWVHCMPLCKHGSVLFVQLSGSQIQLFQG